MHRSLLVIALAGCAPAAPSPVALAARTIVSLSFDDTFADQAQVGALVAARGMHATFFVNSGRVGATGYMTAAQLIALQQAGNEIAGHTISHADLPTLELDEQRRQVCDDRVALLALGLHVTSFAYPFGDATPATEQIAAACGYNAARGVGDLVSGEGCHGCAFANPVPPSDPWNLKTNDSIKVDTSLATLEGYVTQAEANGGGWVPLVMHHVCDGCDSLSVSPTTLAAFLDWLAVRDGTVVETIHEVIGGAVQPGVPGPPATPRTPTGNLIANPSLELDANHDGTPDCWQRGATGTNAATFTLVGDAYDGSVAQRLDVTSFASGARRLVTRQDLGTCAPVGYPGHAYALAAHYAATTPARFTVYYRNAAGGWLYLAQSPLLPATPTWALASFAIPTLPADATALSAGLSIYDVGAITMDAFSLTDADATPPTVGLVEPADGATVSGIVELAATAADAGGIDHVDFLVEGNVVGTASGGALQVAWDSHAATQSVVGIAARAVDRAGNVAISPSHLVTIANAAGSDAAPPSVALTAPGDGATVTGTILLAADASDDVAIQHVDFLVDGQLVGSASSAPYTAPWTPLATGAATITAWAFDTAGNSTISTPRHVATAIGPPPDTTPPAIAITAPAGGALVHGKTPIVTAASDLVGVVRVRFYLDGKQLGTRTVAPFKWNWDASTTLAGPHTLAAQAEDAAGNTASAAIAITVN